MDTVGLSSLVARLSPYKKLLDDMTEFAEWASMNENYASELSARLEALGKERKEAEELKSNLVEEIRTLQSAMNTLDTQFRLKKAQLDEEQVKLLSAFDESSAVFAKRQSELQDQYASALANHEARMKALEDEERRQQLAIEQAREAFRQISKGLLAEQ